MSNLRRYHFHFDDPTRQRLQRLADDMKKSRSEICRRGLTIYEQIACDLQQGYIPANYDRNGRQHFTQISNDYWVPTDGQIKTQITLILIAGSVDPLRQFSNARTASAFMSEVIAFSAMLTENDALGNRFAMRHPGTSQKNFYKFYDGLPVMAP